MRLFHTFYVFICDLFITLRGRTRVRGAMSMSNASEFLHLNSSQPRITQQTFSDERSVMPLVTRFEMSVHNLRSAQSLLFDRGRSRQEFLNLYRKELIELSSICERMKSPRMLNACSQSFAAQYQPQHVSTCITATLQSSLPGLQVIASSKHISLTWTANIPVFTSVPEPLLTSIIKELVVNAIMHNSRNTCIRVSVGIAGHHCTIMVEDDGKGISDIEIRRIKQASKHGSLRYRRYTDVMTDNDLSRISAMTQEYGGSFEIETALKYGTRIRLLLPRVRPVDVARTEPLTQKVGHDCDQHADVLYIASSGHHDHRLLDQLQVNVKLGILPSFALLASMLQKHVPKIIICDGFDIATRFIDTFNPTLFDSRLSEMSVICITRLLSNEERFFFFRSGISQLLERPVTLNEINSLIHNHLKEKRLRELRIAEAIASYSILQEDEGCLIDAGEDNFQQALEQCIDENYHNPNYSQEECAQALCMSARSLQRKISRCYASTFRDVLRRYRIEKARQLILSGESVTNAGFMTGFSSSSYFAKCFKAELGYMPSMLRRRLG